MPKTTLLALALGLITGLAISLAWPPVHAAANAPAALPPIFAPGVEVISVSGNLYTVEAVSGEWFLAQGKWLYASSVADSWSLAPRSDS